MRLIFIYGGAAAGKLTVGRELASRTGLALFHNHLIVDAVAAVFPFGSPSFVRLREEFWLATFAAAAPEGRSLIFTFAPEASVAPDFPRRAKALVEAAGGRLDFIRLTVPADVQEARITNESRADFGKLRSLDLLRRLAAEFAACEAAMPAPALSIDTSVTDPKTAAEAIIDALGLRPT